MAGGRAEQDKEDRKQEAEGVLHESGGQLVHGLSVAGKPILARPGAGDGAGNRMQGRDMVIM
jgi:hypothetical protein